MWIHARVTGQGCAPRKALGRVHRPQGTRLGSFSLKHQTSDDSAPATLSLPIFMFLGRNSAVPALVWGDHRAGSACTDLGSGPTPMCPAAFRDGPHPHLAPICFCSAGVSFPSSLTETEVERSLWGQNNDGVGVTNQRPMGRGGRRCGPARGWSCF